MTSQNTPQEIMWKLVEVHTNKKMLQEYLDYYCRDVESCNNVIDAIFDHEDALFEEISKTPLSTFHYASFHDNVYSMGTLDDVYDLVRYIFYKGKDFYTSFMSSPYMMLPPYSITLFDYNESTKVYVPKQYGFYLPKIIDDHIHNLEKP